MLQFLCRFAFYLLFVTFEPDTEIPKITRIVNITHHTVCQHGAVQ